MIFIPNQINFWIIMKMKSKYEIIFPDKIL